MANSLHQMSLHGISVVDFIILSLRARLMEGQAKAVSPPDIEGKACKAEGIFVCKTTAVSLVGGSWDKEGDT